MKKLTLAFWAAFVFGVLFSSTRAHAASIVVNTTTDEVPANNGNCTLREAIVAANTNAAVDACTAGSGADTITFSVTGTISIIAATPLPILTSPITIDGPGGGASAPQVRIDGNALDTVANDEYGFYLGTGSSGSTIRDMMITRFRAAGILIESSNNTVAGNWVGTDGVTAGLGNGSESTLGGIRIVPVSASANGNHIGGTTPAERNLIEGNGGPGIGVYDYVIADGFTVSNTVIEGNYIGTNPAGTAAGPSGGENGQGIATFNAANLTIGGTTGTTPGGSCTGSCNLVARASGLINIQGESDGTYVSGLTVQGNFIGTNVTGTAALGCYLNAACQGIQLGYGTSGTVGGTTAAARNVISLGPTSETAVYLYNSVNATATAAPLTVEGNYIGVNSAGTAALGNGQYGIWTNPAESLTIGGATPASRNVIVGSGNDGIRIDGGNDLVNTGVLIQNNYIGVLPDGTTAAGNTGVGVNLNNGVASFIDWARVLNNTIANNTGAGVSISGAGSKNTIRMNSLYNNGGLGIDQDQDSAVETNDACDPDSGGNDLQNYPVLTSAGVAGGNITISGTLNSLASSAFTVDFYGNTAAGDEGRIHLGSITVNTSAGCTASFTGGPFATSLVGGNTVTATATNDNVANPNTSELSAAVAVVLTLTPPTVTKTFVPATIPTGGTSTLTIQITNPNGSTLSNIAFTDVYPAPIATAGTPNITNTCGGSATSNATSFSLTGGSLAAGANCTATIDVTSATVGTHTNNVSVTSDAAAAPASADLTVVARPTVTKAFAPPTLAAGGTSTLTISLGNTNAGAITSVNLTDTFPGGLVIATPNGLTNGCGGTATATAGAGSFTLAGGSIPNGGCTIAFSVTSAASGIYANTINTTDVTSSNGSPSAPAGASVTFTGPLTATKSFTPASIAPNGTSTLTITITNPNGTDANNVGFTDTYPAAIANSATPNPLTTCTGGSLTATAGTSALNASGLTVPASSSCTVTVVVTASTAGSHTNTIAAGGITSSNAGANTAPVTATLTVNAPPTVAKAFTPATASIGVPVTLTITLTNPNGVPLTGAAFTDAYPAGLFNGSPTNAVTTCAGGIVAAVAGGSSVALSNGTIPANGSCTVTVSVVGTSAGALQNDIPAGAVTVANANPSTNTATAALDVGSAIPTVSPLMLLLLIAIFAGVGVLLLRR